MDIENQENNQNLSNKVQNTCEENFKLNVQDLTEQEELNGNDDNSEDKILNNNGESLSKKTTKNTIDSDNEEDNIKVMSSRKKPLTIVDSDSEDVPTPHNKSFDENLHNAAVIYMASKNGEIVPEGEVSDNLERLSKLCDSESSAEEEESSEVHFKESPPVVPNKKSKARKLDEKLEKPKRMNAKEALQQRREIRSESQRMTREMNVSLPYHRPKMRTLKEFLEQRPRFASAVPDETARTSPAVALKMSKQQLKIVSKNLSKREKQVEEYFKSDSETEDVNETDKDDKQPTEEEDKLLSQSEDKTSDVDKTDINNQESSKSDENITSNITTGTGDENDDISTATTDITKTVEIPVEANVGTSEEVTAENPEIERNPSVIILKNILVQESNENPIEDMSENIVSDIDQIIPKESHIEELIEIYNNTEEDNPAKIIPEKKKNVTEIVKEKLGDFKPALSKTDDFINLDENVNELVQRFIKHTTKKQPHKHNVHLDIINVANGEIHKEKLEMVVEDDTIPILEKPGERLKKLRDELENKMAEQRFKFWQERIHGKQDTDVDETTKIVDSEDEDILDKVDEDEFTEIEDDESGDEIIGEDDDDNEEVDDDESDKKKSAFLENEAEESDYDDEDKENCSDGDEVEDEEEIEKADIDNMDDEKDLDADDEDEQSSVNSKKKRKLRRVVQAFENDSDDEDSNSVAERASSAAKSTLALDTTDTVEDLSGPTPHQRRQDHTPIKPNVTQTKSDLGFLTPVIQLTGLQSLNSGSKFLHDSPVSPFTMPKPSPCSMSQSGPQKKLFHDDSTFDSEMLDDLADICSGKFATQTQRIQSKQNEEENLNTLKENSENTSSDVYGEPVSTTQDFLEICSGKFTGITQAAPIVHKNVTESEELPKLNSCEEVVESTSSKNTNYTTIMTSNDEIKGFDDKDDERLISQLLDEEELERFKKKFESPEKQVGRRIFDSDEENEISVQKKVVKNCISDEEDSSEEDEEVNSEDGEEEPCEIEYDSEENEIDVTAQRKKLKASDFFENEAELSESEWESADEDEKGLDVLEFEEGDIEKLDESKVKRDLERIHMRRILDDDNHEVKMLQEILLDDGELHGTGRERQFKWRKMDSADDNDENVAKEDDGEVYLDDENENEERWRKTRFEREIFLKKQQESSQHFQETAIEIESTSQIFKLGQAAMKRSLSNTPNSTISNKSNSPDFKSSFMLTSKKGSFLSRSEQVLARVAEFTSKTVNPTIGGPKNSRNFVFHTVQTTTQFETDELENVKKRKADEGTPAVIKKLRLNNISPAVKKVGKSDRVKKLFSDW